MTSERWEDVFVIFDAALATSGAERDGFLARECGDNARLRDKVESLLAAHRDAKGFLSGGTALSTGEPSSPASGILAPGTRIGVFEVESFAGAGGMGEVYRARDTRLDRHVALKILSPNGGTDSRGRARFAYEARAIARLSHPHICALHDLGHHDDVDFLVMEYLNGETLASRLRRGPLPVAEAMRLGIQIAEALDAAQLLEQKIDAQARGRGQPAALAPECRRRLPHVLERGLKDGAGSQVRRQRRAGHA